MGSLNIVERTLNSISKTLTEALLTTLKIAKDNNLRKGLHLIKRGSPEA